MSNILEFLLQFTTLLFPDNYEFYFSNIERKSIVSILIICIDENVLQLKKGEELMKMLEKVIFFFFLKEKGKIVGAMSF